MGKAWSLEQFIRLANAAPRVAVPDIAPLLGPRQWRAAEDALRWRITLTRIARSAESRDVSPIPVDLPSSPLDLLWVGPDGRIQVLGAQPQGVLYRDLLAALQGRDAARIRECPSCGRIYWAHRKDKKTCSDRCRSKKWIKDNPDKWADIQTRHEGKRAERDLAEERAKQKKRSK
jgi:hypothetical protein